MHNAELRISKLDAARRQLETAITIYFSEGDPVSVHTLAAAAYNIVRDVGHHRGAMPMFVKEEVLSYVKPEHVKTVRDKINEAENFFKHADRDPEGVLAFRPFSSTLLLVDACRRYEHLAGESTPVMKSFRTWCILRNPDLFILPTEMQQFLAQGRIAFHGVGRAQFFQQFLGTVSGLKMP